MKQSEWPEMVLFQHLGKYKTELTAYLNKGVVEVIDESGSSVRMRELRYDEKYALLQEVVRIEQEMRVLSMVVETPTEMHNRLLADAKESAARLQTIAEWRRAQGAS